MYSGGLLAAPPKARVPARHCSWRRSHRGAGVSCAGSPWAGLDSRLQCLGLAVLMSNASVWVFGLVLPMDGHEPAPPFLLVEPNNTGAVTDDFERRREAALGTASVSSVGNSVARFLNVPFLVPILPRPASLPLTSVYGAASASGARRGMRRNQWHPHGAAGELRAPTSAFVPIRVLDTPRTER
jgi:hypothetical protein